MGLGKLVIDGIIRNIEAELKPDGSPQKQNNYEYMLAKLAYKQYIQPVKGISKASPVIADPSHRAWARIFLEPNTLHIQLKPMRFEIGRKLHQKGYIFIGITKWAEEEIKKRTDRYFKRKMSTIRMASKSKVLGN